MKLDPEGFAFSEPLMWRMVSAMQINLADAIVDDVLSPDSLSRMLKNCVNCPEPVKCQATLDARSDQIRRPPRYCPNRTQLVNLRTGFRATAKPVLPP